MNKGLVLYYIIGIVSMFIASGAAFYLSYRFKKSVPRGLLYILIGLTGYIFVAQYLKLQSLHMYVDISHWGQVVYSIATRWVPESLNVEFIIPGARNYFSIHFTSFIYIFAFLYRLIPSLETLLLANGIFMLSSGIPLYLLVKHLSSNIRLALFFAVLLFWYPTFQYITLYEFEMLRFSIPILLWMLYFWEKRKLPYYFLFILLAVLVREEVGLTVTMFGVYVFLFEKKRIIGLVTGVIGIATFYIITNNVIPAFSQMTEAVYFPAGLFAKFGTSPYEIVWGMLTNPWLTAQTVFDFVKIANIAMLFVPLLLVPFLFPSALISVLGNIVVNTVSESIISTSYMLYYIAPSVPFIFYAFIKGWSRLLRILESWLPRYQQQMPQAAAAAALAGLFVANIFFGPSPLSLQFWFKEIQPAPFKTQNFHYSVYHATDHHRKAEEFVRMIPDDAIVSAPQFLHPRLYRKRGAMVFPQLMSKDGKYEAEYILVDRTNNDLKPVSPAFIDEQEFAIIEQGGQWDLVAADDGHELYQRSL